jgi:hypothetical protein
MTQIGVIYDGDDDGDYNSKINLGLQRLRVLCVME